MEIWKEVKEFNEYQISNLGTEDDVLFIRTFGRLYQWKELSGLFKVDPKTIRDAYNYKSWAHL